MSHFTVVWPLRAENLLADEYLKALGAGAGTAFSRAIERVEKLLERDPEGVGESRTDSDRIIFDLPASVEFRVLSEVSAVVVLNVRFIPPRRPSA